MQVGNCLCFGVKQNKKVDSSTLKCCEAHLPEFELGLASAGVSVHTKS